MELYTHQAAVPSHHNKVEAAFARLSDADKRAINILMTTALLHPESVRPANERKDSRLNLFRECFKRLRQYTSRW